MMKLQHETLQKLIDRLVEEFEDCNKLNCKYNRGIPELPIANIIAPLYRYFSFPYNIQTCYELIADLERCPDFFPMFYSIIPKENPNQITIILKMHKEYGKYGNTYNPVNHNYVLTFDCEENQKWRFRLEKVKYIANGFTWESDCSISDEDYNLVSYEEFIKDFNNSLKEKGGESYCQV